MLQRGTLPWLLLTVLAHSANAAEVLLEITPPEPEWLLPPESQPCPLSGGGRLEACTLQEMPEGIVEVGEESLAAELAPLLAAGAHEAILARARINFYSGELDLLETGDFEGFLATRRPTDGFRQPGRLIPPEARFNNARNEASGPPMDVPVPGATRPARTSANAPGATLIPSRDRTLPDYISASMLYVIGHSYFSLGRYLPAETAFKLALVGMPNHIRAQESLAMLYLRTERYDDARVHLKLALQRGRNTAHVFSALGYLELKTRRYGAAASAFQRTLVLEPDSRTALRGLLHALSETREHQKARALVEQLLGEEPDDAALWLYRAQMALQANDSAMAIASLETALRLGDDSARNREVCVELHLESGNIARAAELLRRSPARGLAFARVDRVLGWLANENEWDYFRTLAASIDRSALGGPEQSRLLTRRASLALRDNNRLAATTALQEAVTLDPSNPDALMMLGRLHQAEGDYGRADLMFRQASAYEPVRDNALIARADVAIDEEDFDSALTILRNVVTSNPARADLLRNIDVLENLALLRTQR
jgi:tetratricopeptide (TPR) repeat protein